MVKHIVLFTLKDDINKEEAIATAASVLEPLVGRIPGLLHAEVRPCFVGPDFILYTELESQEALSFYADHPLHTEAKSHFFHLLAGRSAADYEV